MSSFMGEVIGTMILIILGNGVVAGILLNKSKAQGGGWLLVNLAWGLAVVMAIYAVGTFSGAHLNPAVTLGLASIGSFPWENVPLYVLGQLTGALLGSAVVYLHYLPHWKATPEQDLKLAVFCTGPAIRHNLSNLLSEIIGTFMLMVGILAIGANQFTEGLNPLIVGLLVVSIGMSLGGTTGYAINPARDLGPRLAHFLLPIHGKGPSGWDYAWIPVLGPLLGGIFGSLFYQSIFTNKFTLIFWLFAALMLLIVALTWYSDRRSSR